MLGARVLHAAWHKHVLFALPRTAPRLYKGEDTSTADDEDTGVPLITVA